MAFFFFLFFPSIHPRIFKPSMFDEFCFFPLLFLSIIFTTNASICHTIVTRILHHRHDISKNIPITILQSRKLSAYIPIPLLRRFRITNSFDRRRDFLYSILLLAPASFSVVFRERRRSYEEEEQGSTVLGFPES
jgi:hypothetical protein